MTLRGKRAKTTTKLLKVGRMVSLSMKDVGFISGYNKGLSHAN